MVVTPVVQPDKCDVFLLSINLNLRSDDIAEEEVGRGKEKIKILCAPTVINCEIILMSKDLPKSGRNLLFILYYVCTVNSFILYNMTSGL